VIFSNEWRVRGCCNIILIGCVLFKDHPELNILGITTQDIAVRAQLGKRLPINRTNQNAGSETKTPTKKRKGDIVNNKGTPTTVSGQLSQMRHSLGSPQVDCGYHFVIVTSNSRSYI
jgi:hypothetical protein